MAYADIPTFYDLPSIRAYEATDGSGEALFTVQSDSSVSGPAGFLLPYSATDGDDAQAFVRSVKELEDQVSQAGEVEDRRILPSGKVLTKNPASGDYFLTGYSGGVGGAFSPIKAKGLAEGLVAINRCTPAT